MSTLCKDDDHSIAAGHAVVLTGWDGTKPKVQRATKDNLDAFKTVYGVAAEASSGSGTVRVLVAGEVADSTVTTTLAAVAPARLVVTNYHHGNPELRYIYDDSG